MPHAKDAAPESPATTGGCGGCAGGGGAGCGAAKAEAAAKAEDGDREAMLSTGDLARACETTVRTVRFYEEEGLIEPAHRSGGNHRMFESEQRQRLQLVMDLREAGLSLQDIRSLFELKRAAATAPEAAEKMACALEAQIEQMQRKITVLRRLREELASMVATIRECRACEEPDFHARCEGCDVMHRDDLPRAMRLLWSSGRGPRG